jgi:aspartyl protease family protein
MKLTDQDRPVPVLTSDSRPFWSAALAIVMACAAALAAFPQVRDYAKGLAFTVGDAVGVTPPDSEYSAAYKRMGMAPLPARLLASSQISSGLARLGREPCDKTAIFAFGEALLAAHEERKAADAYSAFAASCPNGEGEQNRAAQILFQLGDSEKVIAITDALIAKNPAVGSYRYLRGKALANTKRYAEAVEDYKSAIQLQKDPRDVGDWVFVEMANIYAAMGRPCDAATTILAWVAIDPTVRNTLNVRKTVEAYSAKGCGQNPAPTDLKKL